MFKRMAASLMALAFLAAYPAQIAQAGRQELRLELPPGANPYVLQEREALSSAQMDALLQELGAEYRVSPPQWEDPPGRKLHLATPSSLATPTSLAAPADKAARGLFRVAGPAEDPYQALKESSFRLYPITEKRDGQYGFRGLLVGGKIDTELVFNRLAYTLPGQEAPFEVTALSETDRYPDSSAFGSSQYKAETDNWQGASLLTDLAEDTLYTFNVTLSLTEPATPTQVPATPSQLPKEITLPYSSEAFLLYTLKPGDTLAAVARHYGTPLAGLTADNHLAEGDVLLRAGDTLFVRNPATDKPLSRPRSSYGGLPEYLLGEREGAQYGYGAVNLATGNLYYASEDITLEEYQGFSITRNYNSLAASRNGPFGYGFSSSLFLGLAAVQEGLLVTFGDGQELLLKPQPGGFWQSADEWFTLLQTKVGYTLTDVQGNLWQFNPYGQIAQLDGKQGLPITYVYDGAQLLSAVLSQSGARFSIGWDGGRVSSLQKPDGTSLQYGYTEGGFLAAMTDEEGYASLFTYQDGLLTGEINALGNAVSRVGYDGDGRAVSYQNATEDTAAFQYDEGWTDFTDQRGVTNRYHWDARGRIIQADYADGGQESSLFDNMDRLLSFTDKAGGVTAYVYDAAGNLLERSYQGEPQETYTYDGQNNCITSTDAAGRVTAYAYDGRGNNTEALYPDGTKQTFAYDGRNRLISVTTAQGETIRYGYAGNGFGIAEVSDAKGGRISTVYDPMGRPLQVTDGSGTTTYTYTPAGRLASMQTPDGRVETYRYDAVGNNTGVIDPKGNETKIQYDANGRVIGVISGDNSMLTMAYDANGNLLSQTNARGETFAYEYDSNGELAKESAPDGSAISYRYDGKGRVIEEKDADGDTHTYEYHPTLDLVVKEKDELNRVTAYEYDASGSLLKMTLPDGASLSNTYDSMGRLLTATDERGVVTTYTYDANGNVAKMEDTAGGLTTYAYDANGNLLKETDALGNSTTYAYDSADRLLSATDATGHSTAYTYDAMGQTLTETDRAGNVTVYTYDGNGNIHTKTDSNGFVTTYTYDATDRLIKEERGGFSYGIVYDGAGNIAKTVGPYGSITAMEYDGKGRLVKLTDALGGVTTYAYDNDGNTTRIGYPDGSEERYTYNKAGWLLSAALPTGLVTHYEYDRMGRLTRTKNNQGQAERYAYDKTGNLLRHTDALGRATTYVYDSFSRLLQENRPDGSSLRYAYDRLERLVKMTDGQGRETRFVYDGAGNLTRLTRHDGLSQTYTVDGNGRVTSLTDELGMVSSLAYDGNGNITRVTAPDASAILRQYDFNGQMTAETNPLGNTYAYAYDALQHLTQAVSPEGVAVRYEYDALGRKTAIQDGAGTTSFAYDSMGRVVRQTDPNGNTTTYAYTAGGLLAEITAANGGKTQYAYDALGNVVKTTYPNGMEQTYAYDALGRLVSETSPEGVTTQYAYDSRGNLARISDSTGQKVEYAFDAYNRKARETTLRGGVIRYAYDSFDRVTRQSTDQGASVAYEYDAVGRLVKLTDALGLETAYSYDQNGRLLQEDAGGRVTRYAYDAAGGLLSITQPDGAAQAFAYDRDGRLIEETGPMGDVTAYVYDKAGRLSATTDALGRKTALRYDAAGNLAAKTLADGSTHEYQYDSMNRLCQVVEPGGVTSQYSYDAMGNLAEQRTKAQAEPLGAQAQRRVLYTYTPESRLASILNGADEASPAGKQEGFSYTPAGQRSVVTNPSGKGVSHEYDAHGNLARIAYPDDPAQTPAISLAYDTWGRVTEMADGLGRTQYAYNAAGQLTKAAYSEGMELGYTYNAWGEATGIEYPDGASVAYTRDSMGRVTALTDRDGGVIRYTYDAAGRITSTRLPDGAQTTQAYDLAGRLTHKENLDAAGGRISRYAYEYDSLDRIVQETIEDAGGKTTRTYTYDQQGQLTACETQTPEGAETAQYEYDGLGNRTQAFYQNAEGKKTTATYSYDAYDRLVEEREGGLITAVYAYDADGNLVEKKAKNEITEYAYTPDGKLLATTVNGRLMEQNVYDGNGLKAFSLLRKEYPNFTPALLQAKLARLLERKQALVEAETATPEEAAAAFAPAQVPAAEAEAAAAGGWEAVEREIAPTEGEKRWAWVRCYLPAHLLSAYAPPMAQGLWDMARQAYADLCASVEKVVSFVYNEGNEGAAPEESAPGYMELAIGPAEGDTLLAEPALRAKYLTSETYLLILKKLPSVSGTSVYYEPTRYLYDMTLENPEVLAEYGNSSELRSAYTYGDDTARLSGGDGKRTAYYLYDGRGSVSETLEAGKVTGRQRYDAYGGMTAGGAKQDKQFGYNGEEYTPQTGLLYLRARFYAPAQGRFTTQDSYLGNLTESISRNRYAYCGNDPQNYADPSGHKKSNTSSSRGSSSSSGSGVGSKKHGAWINVPSMSSSNVGKYTPVDPDRGKVSSTGKTPSTSKPSGSKKPSGTSSGRSTTGGSGSSKPSGTSSGRSTTGGSGSYSGSSYGGSSYSGGGSSYSGSGNRTGSGSAAKPVGTPTPPVPVAPSRYSKGKNPLPTPKKSLYELRKELLEQQQQKAPSTKTSGNGKKSARERSPSANSSRGSSVIIDQAVYMAQQIADQVSAAANYTGSAFRGSVQTAGAWWNKNKGTVTGAAIEGGIALLVVATAGGAGLALGPTISGLAGEVGVYVSASQASTAVTAALDTTAGVIVATGASDAIEAGSGYNPIRDGLFGGSQAAYDATKGVTHAVAGYGIAAGLPPLVAQRQAQEHMPEGAFESGNPASSGGDIAKWGKQDINLNEIDYDNLPDGWTRTDNNGFTHIRDANGEIRIRIDPPDSKTPYQHKHYYDTNKIPLDVNGNITKSNSPNAHIPHN